MPQSSRQALVERHWSTGGFLFGSSLIASDSMSALAICGRQGQTYDQEDCSTADAASDPSGKGQARTGAWCCSTGSASRVVIWGPSSPRSSAEERVVSTHLAGGSNPSGGTMPAAGFARQPSATERCCASQIGDVRDARFGSAAPLIVLVIVVVVVFVVLVIVMVFIVVVVVVVVVGS